MSFSIAACCNSAEELLNQHPGKARKLHENPRVLNLPSGVRSVTDCRTQEHPTPQESGSLAFGVFLLQTPLSSLPLNSVIKESYLSQCDRCLCLPLSRACAALLRSLYPVYPGCETVLCRLFP